MAQRQVRGVMAGVFDQVDPGFTSVRTIEDPVVGGRTTISGITVQPSQRSNNDLPPGDPLIQSAARTLGSTAGITLDPVTPMFTETREASQQDVNRFPWWLAAIIVGLAMA